MSIRGLVGIAVVWIASAASAQIAQVQLVSPANNAVGVAPCVTLDWNAASGATGYDYEVKQGSTVVASGGSGGATSIDLTLAESTTYTWRVRGRTSQMDGPWSSTRTFTTKTPIPAPSLTSPANGLSHIGLIVDLEWQQITDATAYDYEVYQNGNITTSGAIADNANPIVTVTLSEGAFTWRVRGKTSCRLGAWSGFWSFEIPPIPAPVQVSPANNATGIGLQPVLQWQSLHAFGADDYDYELYQGGTLIASNSTGNLTQTVPTMLTPSTDYSWRVKGHTTARSGLWSGFWNFTTRPPLVAPVLISPVDGADGTGLGLNLHWQPVPGATGHEYEVLQNGIVVRDGSGPSPQAVSLPSHGRYDWHVRGRTSSQNGPWSSTWTFITTNLPPIGSPQLVNPIDRAMGLPLGVTIQWNTAPNATGYDYELYAEAILLFSGSTNGSLQASFVLDENTEYSWRVRGKTSLRTGQWSEARTFSTKKSLEAPILLSPTDNQEGVGISVILSWLPVADATGYDYEILQAGSVFQSGSGQSPSPVNLASHGIYDWHVRGKTSLRNGTWSASRKFDTRVFSITNQPGDIVVTSGNNATFSVGAQGSGPFEYQWRKNGANIVGATNSLITITNVQFTDQGVYDVVVRNPTRLIVSAQASLHIGPIPPVLPFSDAFSARGSIAGLSGLGRGFNTNATSELNEPLHAYLSGGRSIWLQWVVPASGEATFDTVGSFFDTSLAIYSGTNLSTLTNVTSDDNAGGFYASKVNFAVHTGETYVIALDGVAGQSGEAALRWNVNTNRLAPPTIVAGPTNLSVPLGSDATFTTTVTSQIGVTHQWFFLASTNNSQAVLIPGATQPSLTISNVQNSDLGGYFDEVTANLITVASVVGKLGIGEKFPNPSLVASAAYGFMSVSVGTSSGITYPTSPDGNTNAAPQFNGHLSLAALGNATIIVDTLGSGVDTTLQVQTNADIFPGLVAFNDDISLTLKQSRVMFSATSGTVYLATVGVKNGGAGIVTLNWKMGNAPTNRPDSQAKSFSLTQGEAIVLNGIDTNAAPAPTYQWQYNGTNIVAATNATFMSLGAAASQCGTFSVVVSNLMGVVTNMIASVSVEAELKSSFEQGKLRVTGSSTQGVVLLLTTNLQTWTPLFTNSSPTRQVNYVDTNAVIRPKGFYRFNRWP